MSSSMPKRSNASAQASKERDFETYQASRESEIQSPTHYTVTPFDLQMTDVSDPQAPDTAQVPVTGFMSMPRELRHQVYDHLLPHRSVKSANVEAGVRHTYTPLELQGGRLKDGIGGLQLLTTSSLVNEEFCHIMYSYTFHVGHLGTSAAGFTKAIDFETELPRGPSRDKIRKSHFTEHIIYSIMNELSDLAPLKTMRDLSHFTLSLVILDEGHPWTYTVDSFQRSMILHGVAAHVMRHVRPGLHGGAFSTHGLEPTSDEHGWLWVPGHVIIQLLKKYKRCKECVY